MINFEERGGEETEEREGIEFKKKEGKLRKRSRNLKTNMRGRFKKGAIC